MNRLSSLFEKKQTNIVSLYFTAGFPYLGATTDILEVLQNSGKIDLVEIGIPFSDPTADGETIQKSNMTALHNGMNVKKLFEQLRSFKDKLNIPVILMGYLNPILQYGMEKFCQDCEEVGVSGLIVPDLPLPEYLHYAPLFDKHDLLFNFLITPQTEKHRVEEIASQSKGFIYAVSSYGITGFNISEQNKNEDYFNFIQKLSEHKKVLIGFGISDKKGFDFAAQYASGAIIGSAFIRVLEQEDDTLHEHINRFINQF